ncbi:hypothetical protein NST99_23325 [Paenibacillus sp. FSL L8-0470]|uniref:hypothetical protein n=1 Tax=Paenibacillus sp. FSL L8-0463 TaxID=2954687 RepID=UPI0030F529AE
MKKFKETIAIEAAFSPGYQWRGIWAFLSGLGAKKIIIIKLVALINNSLLPEKWRKKGIRTHNRVVTMLQAVAVLK